MQSYRYSLSITSQFFFCGIPFRIDTAPKCQLNCSYCFAMARGGRRTSVTLLCDSKKILRKFQSLENTEKSMFDVNDELLLKKTPIHFGGMSDPFSTPDVQKVTLEILKILSDHDYPIVLSTKQTDFLASDEVVQVLSKIKHLIIQVSISSESDSFLKKIEPNVPLPSKRLSAMKVLSDEGFIVFARIQPLFPNIIKNVYENLIPKIGEAGAKHIIVEFLKLPVEKNLSLIDDLFTEIQWNGYNYYQKNFAKLVGREWVLPANLKLELLSPVKNTIRSLGMTYGAGDYGLNHLGDTNCCCGLDLIPGFENWYKGNFSFLIQNNRTNVIMFKELKNIGLPKSSIRMYVNSHSRIKTGNTLVDYLRDKWNHPGTANAPDSYLGVKWEGEYDEENNCIYSKTPILD